MHFGFREYFPLRFSKQKSSLFSSKLSGLTHLARLFLPAEQHGLWPTFNSNTEGLCRRSAPFPPQHLKYPPLVMQLLLCLSSGVVLSWSGENIQVHQPCRSHASSLFHGGSILCFSYYTAVMSPWNQTDLYPDTMLVFYFLRLNRRPCLNTQLRLVLGIFQCFAHCVLG